MTIEVKICGIKTAQAAAAAVNGGADYIGLNFYPHSPRALSPKQAHALAAQIPARVKKVALVVDADDATLGEICAAVPLDLLQLHGNESPERVARIKALFGLPVMKTVKVADAGDINAAQAYGLIADRLLFDAKAPSSMKGALPGGNALVFDWTLLAGRSWPVPWMLAGGLHAGNLAAAVHASHARAVDVASGVEDKPGVKNPAKIQAFLDAARAL